MVRLAVNGGWWRLQKIPHCPILSRFPDFNLYGLGRCLGGDDCSGLNGSADCSGGFDGGDWTGVTHLISVDSIRLLFEIIYKKHFNFIQKYRDSCNISQLTYEHILYHLHYTRRINNLLVNILQHWTSSVHSNFSFL